MEGAVCGIRNSNSKLVTNVVGENTGVLERQNRKEKGVVSDGLVGLVHMGT
jgi:hypothetical protein